MRWIPVDVAASVVSRLTFNAVKDGMEASYYHLENPTSTPWSIIANAVSQYKGQNLPQVPFAEWLSRLQERAKVNGDAERIPAIRLLDFFEDMKPFLPMRVENSSRLAPEVNYGAISPELLQRYLEYQQI